MPIKKILQIEVDDAQFKRFSEIFDRYKAAVAQLPQDWGKVGVAVGGVTAAHERAAVAAEKQVASAEKQAAALKGAKRDSDSIFQNWRSIATSAHNLDKTLERSVVTMAKWGGLAGGVLGGLIGIGSLLGLERLAGSIGAARTRAMGLGISYGQERAYDVNYSPLVHPGDIMSNIATAKYDLASDQYKGLMAAGVSQKDIETKNTAQLFSEFMHRIPTIFAGVPKGMIGTTAQQTGLTNIASVQDIVAYLNASPEERKQREEQTEKDSKDMDLQDSVQRQWQDFITQLGRATETIKAKFMDKISIIEPGLEELSKFFTGMVTKFVDSGAAKVAINWLGVGLQSLADFVGKKEFQDGIGNFAKWVGDAAKSLWKFVSFFGGVTPAQAHAAPSAKELNTGDFKVGDVVDPITGKVTSSGSLTPNVVAFNEEKLGKGTSKDVVDYIKAEAIAKGIDPNIALRVAAHEGLKGYDPGKMDFGGDEHSSFGPFQLHYGGMSPSMPHPGLGDEFTKKTGEKASDPSTWKDQVDFSLDYARQHGWGSWMGAGAEGITGFQGIGPAPQAPETHQQPPMPRSVVIRPQSGANAPRSFFSIAQPYAPAAQ